MQVNRTNEVINRIDTAKNKVEITNTLINIKFELEKLKALSMQHNDTILNKDPELKDVLKEEKALCLRKKQMEHIDLD